MKEEKIKLNGPGYTVGINEKQKLFYEILLGTLIYSVVLGFFNDYTDIIATKSFSTTFALAFVMQLLTLATLKVKKTVVKRHKQNTGANRLGLILSVWLVLFLSKFIFLAVIERVFGSEVQISGFVGLMLVIVCMTAFQKAVEVANDKLSTSP